jgi:hypothetical protein
MAVASHLYANPIATTEPTEVPLSPVDCLFCVGSPKSSGLSASFVPSNFAIPNRQLLSNRSEIPYHFFSAPSNALSIKNEFTEGARRSVRTSGITADGGHWFPPPPMASPDNSLLKDFCLLTVLPWNQVGGTAVFVCGGHGPGTAALHLLLKPTSFRLTDLEKLVSDLDGARAFQVVFEVPVRDDAAYSASGIRVSKDLPPKKIKTTSSLLCQSDDRIFEIITAHGVNDCASQNSTVRLRGDHRESRCPS